MAMLDLEMVPVDGLDDEAVFCSGVLRVHVGESVLQVLTWHSDLDAALALSRLERGLAGFLYAEGEDAPEIFAELNPGS